MKPARAAPSPSMISSSDAVDGVSAASPEKILAIAGTRVEQAQHFAKRRLCGALGVDAPSSVVICATEFFVSLPMLADTGQNGFRKIEPDVDVGDGVTSSRPSRKAASADRSSGRD